MMTRRITAPMLYTRSCPARWLDRLAAEFDEAAARLARWHWQHGPRPALVPLGLERRRERTFVEHR
jgi:hypothetical protein